MKERFAKALKSVWHRSPSHGNRKGARELATLFGRSGIAAMLRLAIAGIPYTLRVTMTLTVSAFGADQVTAARVVGVPHRRLMLRYVLPQIAEPLVTISMAQFCLPAPVFRQFWAAVSYLRTVGIEVTVSSPEA